MPADARAEPGAAADVVARLRGYASSFGDMSDVRLYAEWQREDQALLRNAAAEIERLRAEGARMREALRSIAANTCCGTCQEAALVARAALRAVAEAAGGAEAVACAAETLCEAYNEGYGKTRDIDSVMLLRALAEAHDAR